MGESRIDIPLEQTFVLNKRSAAKVLGITPSALDYGADNGWYPKPFKYTLGGRKYWRTEDVLRAKEDGAGPPKERRPKSAALGPGVTHLYRHFDAEGQLLYIGISLSAVARLGDHREHSHWFWSIARIEITAYPTRKDAMKAERISIQREKPLHNIVHAVKDAA